MICDTSVPCSCTDIEGKEIGMVDTKHMDQCWRMGSQSCLACDETYSLYQMNNGRYMCGWNPEFGSSAAMNQVEAESTGTLVRALTRRISSSSVLRGVLTSSVLSSSP